MRYQMKQKLLSLGQDFTIEDEEGNAAYKVDGRAISFGAKYSFQDAAGEELAFISQKVLSLKKRYQIFREEEMVAEVIRDFSWRALLGSGQHSDRLTIDVPGPDDYSVQGSFFRCEYRFTRGGQQVAQVSRNFFSFSDSYGIDISEGEDEVLILASAVVIDHICDSDESRDND